MKQIQQFITKEMTIADVIEKYPSTIETLLMSGVQCIGCHVSYSETLEEGFKEHEMGDEEIDEIINKLNKVVSNENIDNSDIKITDKAASKVKEVLKDKTGLRIEVIPGGCAGYMYNITTENKTNKDDIIVEDKGVKVILDKESFEKLKGAKLDYVDSLQGAGLKIHNPNAKSTCGCGHSFG